MTDFASLVLAVDSTSVPKGTAALDNLAESGDNATRAANLLARAEREKALEAERAAAGLVKASSAAGMARMEAMGLAQANATVTASAGAQRAGMQQLSYQIGDAATMFSLGANASQIFASQIGQTLGAVQLMTGGTSKLATFLGGPWGIAITAATVILAPFIGRLFDTADAATTAKNALYDLIDAQRKKAAEDAKQTLAAGQLNALRDERLRLLTLRDKGPSAGFNREFEAQAIRNSDARLRSLNLQIAEGEAALAASEYKPVDRTAAAHERATRAVGGHAAAVRAAKPVITEDQRAYEQALKTVQERINTLNEENALRAILNNQVAQGLITSEEADKQLAIENQLRPLIVAGLKANGAELATYRKVLSEANKEQERSAAIQKAITAASNLNSEAARTEAQATAWRHYKDAVAALPPELRGNHAALENLQQVRDDEIAQLEYDNELKGLQVQLSKALADGDKAVADAIQKQIDAMVKSHDAQVRLNGIQREGVDTALSLADAYDRVASALGHVGGIIGGGVGSTISGIGSAVGQFGQFGNNAGNLSEAFNRLGLGSGVSGVLGKGFAGIGLGGTIGGLFGGNGNTGGSIGGGLGGAIFGPVGGLVGGLIGGIIGAIFGGDPDQAVATLNLANGKAGYGNLFKEGKNKDEYAQQVGSAADAVAQALNSIVGSLGGTLTGGLGNISIGQYKGKWAVNDGSKPGFRGLAAGDPGATVYGSAEEAIAAAIQLAVKNATTGLSDQVKNLVGAPGTDLDTQLAKAQAFQAVLKDAAEATHPLGEALKALQQQFDQLDAIFAEAGATTEQLAQLTKYETDQRKALVGAFTQFITENFSTDAEKLAKATADVAAEMDRLGLSNVTTKAQFKALADGVDVTTDAGVALLESLVKIAPEFLMVANAAEQAAASAQALAEAEAQAAAQRQAEVARQKSDLDIELAQALGDKTLALALSRERELAAIDESLRPQKLLIWSIQDHAAKVSEARNVLAQSYQRERSELQQTASRLHNMADSLRNFRASIYSGADGTTRNAALARLMITGGQAAAGNENAVSSLPGVTNAFLDASRNSASTLVQYRRDQALAASYVDKAIAGIDSQASAADRQIAALDKQVEGLLDLNDNVVTVDQAVKDLTALMEAPAAVLGNNRLVETQEEQVDLMDRLVTEVQRLNADSSALQFNMAERLARIERFISRGETDGFRVFNDTDTPLYTSAVV